MSAQIEYLKKITAKSLGAVRKDLQVGEKVEAYRVAGTARGFKSVVTQFGESFGLVGDFAAISSDGGTKKAPVLFLPSGATAPVMEALRQQIERGDENPSIEFAVAVFATGIEAKAGGSNYEWTFAPLVQSEESASERLLRQTIAAVPLKLAAKPAAPVQEEPPVDTPTDAKPAGKGSKSV